MKEKEKARIKDSILVSIRNRDNRTMLISELSELISMDFYIVFSLCESMLDSGHLEQLGMVNVSDIDFRGDRIVLVSPKGLFLLNHEGGFNKSHNNQVKQQIWIIAKIAISVINAVAILLIAAWGISINKKTNELEKEVELKNKKIEIITNELEILKNK